MREWNYSWMYTPQSDANQTSHSACVPSIPNLGFGPEVAQRKIIAEEKHGVLFAQLTDITS